MDVPDNPLCSWMSWMSIDAQDDPRCNYRVIIKEGQKVESCYTNIEYVSGSNSALKSLPSVGHFIILSKIENSSLYLIVSCTTNMITD